MSLRLSPDNELLLRVDEVLHYVWDPIGVSEAPQARDEYSSYLPQALSLVNKGAAAKQIAEYLLDIEVDRMGLKGDKDKCMRAAELLVEWRDVIRKRNP